MKNKLQILTIALVTLIFTNGYSAAKTWNGSAWSPSGTPGSGDDVTINSGTYKLTANLTWKSLTMNAASTTIDLNGFVLTMNGDIILNQSATFKSSNGSKLNATGDRLTVNNSAAQLTLDNVELVIDDLRFNSSNDINGTNGGFLSFDNSDNHTITSVSNAGHVTCKVRLYTENKSSYNSFAFPVGNGTVYSPFIFTPTSVTNASPKTDFSQWVEVTYTGAKASTTSIATGTGSGANSTLLNTVSGYEYWTVASSATNILGRISLRYDANTSGKTGKSLIGTVTNIASDLKLSRYNGTNWVGVPSGNATSSSITTSSSTATNLNPSSTYTIASAAARTSFMAPLPVTLMNFDAVASKNNKSVEVKWATASEENNSHFEIMHSTDFVNWISIGTVYSKGNGNDMNVYSFTDINPNTVNNYKLKIVAFNGEVSYSSIKLVKFTETVSTTVKVYPNPANANVNLSVDNMDMSAPVTIQLMNPMGQVVFEQIITENYSGMMNTTIPTSEFTAGIYQVTISGTTGTVSQKLIINH